MPYYDPFKKHGKPWQEIMKKAKGERNLKNVGDRWFFDFSKGGKRYIRLGGRTKEEAREAMWKLKGEIKNGSNNRQAEDPLFEDFAKEYIELYAKPRKRSWERDERSIKHLNRSFGKRRLSQLSLLLVERYRVGRQAQVSFSTVNRELACLKGIISKALDWEKLASFPLRKIKIDLKAEPRRDRILSRDEEGRLLKEAGRHLHPMIVLALNTGMRQGEILKLRAEHINFDKRRITIPAENSKSNKPRRIPLNSTVVDLLRPLVRDQGFVFAKSTGETFRRICGGFKAACMRAKINNLRFHDLRHTFETRSIEGGANPANVRETMGHHSITFSLDHYYHPSWDMLLHDAELVARKDAKDERMDERMPSETSVSHSRANN